MPAANMIETQQLGLKRWIVVKMVNALKRVIRVKIVVQMVQKKWIAAKMVNAPKKVMMGKIAAKRKELLKWTVVKSQIAVKNHDLFLN